MAARIEVVRPKGKGFRRDMFGSYRILIDGDEIARLREGQTCALELAPGNHEASARINWVETPPHQLELADGEVARLSVRPGGSPWKGLKQALREPQSYLILERL